MARPAAAAVLLLTLPCLSGCGGDAIKDRIDAGRGGTLTLLTATDVDFLDPGRTYFASGLQVAAATQRPLYTYVPGDPSRPRPDLAAAMPRVSADGHEVTVTLRRGVRFSPPVGREVTSADVAYALRRIFSVQVGGQYTSYFSDLVGAPEKPTDGVPRIAGITTPDARTIVFRLRHRTSAAFIGALTMPASAPVPESYARPLDARTPSDYNMHLVATGPYMVRNDDGGNAVGYQPGRRIELVRNPSWRRSTDRRPAHVDRVVLKITSADSALSARQVLAGSHTIGDPSPPPTIIRRLSRSGELDHLQIPAGSYRFLPINTTLKPFDDLNVRKAVVAVFDRAAARQARGGPVTGPLATHFLPPGVPGHEEAGGAAGPKVDFLSADKPHGDPELAARYMRKAGYPTGRYTGEERFLMAAGNTPGERSVALVVQAQFAKLGFRTRIRYVSDDALFTSWCPVPARRLLSCGSGLAWLKDFADPQPMLQPVFDGRVIRPSGNTNYSELDDPRINAAFTRALPLTGAARRRAWGAIDRMIVASAAAIPLQWDRTTLIRSKDVLGVPNPAFGSWDFSYTSLK